MRRGYFFPRRIPVEFMRQAEIQSGWMEWEAAVGDTKSTFCGGDSRERSGKMSERNGTTTQWNKVAFFFLYAATHGRHHFTHVSSACARRCVE